MTLVCIMGGASTRRLAMAALLALGAGCRDRRTPSASQGGDETTVRGAVSISSELILDAPAIGASIFSRSPAVAFDGQEFLVVYGDEHGTGTGTVSAVRVSPAGTVLDALGTIVGYASTPTTAVAFGGGRSLVAWSDGDTYEVYVRAVGANGQPIGAAVRVWANDFYDEYEPSVAFDGTNFVVCFRTSHGQIVASRVAPSGALVDTTPKVIVDASSSGASLSTPRLAFDGANYQLVWQQGTGVAKVLGVVLSPALVVGGSMATLSPSTAYSATAPALAFNGSQHLFAWVEPSSSSDTAPAIRAARLDPSGAVSPAVTVGLPAAGNASPAVAADGTGWVVTWTESTGTFPNVVASVKAARVDAQGTLLDATPLLVSDAPGSKATPWAACGGGTCLAAWADGRASSNGLYGARMTAGANLDPGGILIGTTYNNETHEAMASRGTDYLVVWADTRDGGGTVYGARVDASGTTLDVPSRRISDAVAPSGADYPAAASDGTNYLVVWDQGSANLLGVSLVDGATGTPGPAQALPAFQSYKPAVAYAGSQYLAVWTGRATSAATDYSILGARFDRQGNAIDTTPINVTAPSSGFGDNVKLATDGTDFLAVWELGSVILGTRIDKNGQVLDSPPLSVRPADVTTNQSSPGVAFDGSRYLVVWRSLNFSILGAHVGPDGSLPDATSLPLLITGNSVLYDAPALAFDGSNFLVAYHRDVYDASDNSMGSLLVQAFSPGLTPGAGGGVTNVCKNCSSVGTTPAVVAGNGQALMAFIRPDTSMGYELDRVRMVMFTETPVQGSPCTATASCPSGELCVDGVCCDTACAGGTADCQACSVAAGAARSGTCGPVVAGQSCLSGTTSGLCSGAGACTPLPPDAGSDATGGADAGTDGGRADASDGRPAADGGADGPSTIDARDAAGESSTADARDAKSGDGAAGATGTDASSPPSDAAGGLMDGSASAADAGGRDGGSDTATTTAPAHSGCGCATAGAPDGGAAALAAGALVSILVARRRPGRRPGGRAAGTGKT